MNTVVKLFIILALVTSSAQSRPEVNEDCGLAYLHLVHQLRSENLGLWLT